jgi:hypothetical protein
MKRQYNSAHVKDSEGETQQKKEMTIPGPVECGANETPVSAVLRSPDKSVDLKKAFVSAFPDSDSETFRTADGVLSQSGATEYARVRVDFCMNPNDNSLGFNRLIEQRQRGHEITVATFGSGYKDKGDYKNYLGARRGTYGEVESGSVKSSGLFEALTAKDTAKFGLSFVANSLSEDGDGYKQTVDIRKTNVPGVVTLNNGTLGVFEMTEDPDAFFKGECYNGPTYKHIFKKEGMYEFNINACHFPGDRAYIPTPVSFTATITDANLLKAGFPATLKASSLDETLKTLVLHHGMKWPAKGIAVRANGIELLVRGFGEMDDWPICAGWRKLDAKNWTLMWTESENPSKDCGFKWFMPGELQYGLDQSFEYFAKRTRETYQKGGAPE